LGDRLLKWFQKKKSLTQLEKTVPSDHIIKKIGTPTMGGLVILMGIIVSVIMWSDLTNIYILFLLYILISLGLLGALDDYKKITNQNSSGISFKFKFLSQIILSVIGISFLTYYLNYQELTNLYFPFFKDLVVNLGWFFFSIFSFYNSRCF
jgi:phospho-N-acetylmuramoyl-pentapeptide-transferase